MIKKWMGDYFDKEWTPVFVEIEPLHEIVGGEVIKVESEFMGYDDRGNEIWTNPQPILMH